MPEPLKTLPGYCGRLIRRNFRTERSTGASNVQATMSPTDQTMPLKFMRKKQSPPLLLFQTEHAERILLRLPSRFINQLAERFFLALQVKGRVNVTHLQSDTVSNTSPDTALQDQRDPTP